MLIPRNQINVVLLRQVLDYCPSTGVFVWKVRPSRNVRAGTIAGGLTSDGYWQIRFDGRSFKGHRLAYAYMHGIASGECIDHIDGDKRNNRIDNLRSVSSKVNQQNRRKAKLGAKSKFLGVFYRKIDGKWTSSIQTEAGRVFLGVFDTEIEASNAYLKAKRDMHQGCTI